MTLPRKDMNELIEKAEIFSTRAHKRIDHRRKYTGQPYQVHLKAVADLVESGNHDPEMIAAAWLHDTIEDTPATIEEIETEFGKGVAQLVGELTDVSKPSDGNRQTRKAIDCEHTAQASPRAQTIKLADLIDNCQDLCKNDPGFAHIWVAEMNDLLGVLTRGDTELLRTAHEILKNCLHRLGMPLQQ